MITVVNGDSILTWQYYIDNSDANAEHLADQSKYQPVLAVLCKVRVATKLSILALTNSFASSLCSKFSKRKLKTQSQRSSTECFLLHILI